MNKHLEKLVPDNDLEQTPVQTKDQVEESRQLSLRSGSVPNSVAGYDILRCLGEGSFGTVWLGRERKTGRPVAVKFFSNRRGLDWSLLTREVEKLAALDASRDVVRLLDVGWDHDPPYFVMEHLPNSSVGELLKSGPLSLAQAVEIAKSVSRALIHAHGAGILHCDIKPANVLLDHGDQARLGDFGQSRLSTDQSPSLGSFFYMAPEQAAVNAIPDVRWDVYALGALLYHMVTGEPPYRTHEHDSQLREARRLDERLQVYHEIIETSPPPSKHRLRTGIDPPLVNLIDRCLEPDPSARMENVQKVLDALEKRELNQAKRPLIVLGFLGPILFMLALIWIASGAIPNTVGQAMELLNRRALDSDAATVQLLAASIQQELDDRKTELERLALTLAAPENDPGYSAFRTDLFPVLDEWKRDTDVRLMQQGRTHDESLFLTDLSGVQIYRDPWEDKIGWSFSYRDYFHGLGKELDPAVDDVSHIAPRKTAGISLAFRSTVTAQYMVAIAVPVWDRAGTDVIGVLARTIHLSDLLSQWEQRIQSGGRRGANLPAQEKVRFLSLIDMREERPYLLDHDWMTEQNLKPLKDDNELKEMLQLTTEEEERIERALRAGRGMADDYVDPLADVDRFYGDRWLAAVAEVGDLRWAAVVQERRDDAEAPMTGLYWVFLRYGLVMLVVFTVMLLLLWWLIQRAANS